MLLVTPDYGSCNTVTILFIVVISFSNKNLSVYGAVYECISSDTVDVWLCTTRGLANLPGSRKFVLACQNSSIIYSVHACNACNRKHKSRYTCSAESRCDHIDEPSACVTHFFDARPIYRELTEMTSRAKINACFYAQHGVI